MAGKEQIEAAALIAALVQREQSEKRDQYEEESEDWQVYNQGVFIAGKIERAIRALTPSP